MFITFEGGEGAGKSTAIRSVAAALRTDGHEVIETREPGAGEVGARIRALLLEGGELDPRAELFLFLADRAQHVASVVRPALARGALVLCDRHGDSTVVYQGVARGLPAELARELNDFATGGLKPELTFLFDIDPEVGLARLERKDRLDREPMAFHTRVREGFLAEAELEPERWVILDAAQRPEALAAQVVEMIRQRLSDARTP